MTGWEKEINKRFRIGRELSRRTQSQVAQTLGTTRIVIASIESGQTPLRYFLGDLFCEKYDVCQKWLALGLPPQHGYVRVPEEVALNVRPKELFSVAYRNVVGHGIERSIREAEALARSMQAQLSQAIGDEKRFLEWLRLAVRLVLTRVPPDRIEDYVKSIVAMTSAFIQRHSIVPRSSPEKPDTPKKRGSEV